MGRVRGTTSDRSAAAAIGSTIMLVAMISVSGAAGSLVIDQTQDSAQDAQSTFDDAMNSIMTALEVQCVIGHSSSDGSFLTGVDLIVTLRAGSPDINLQMLSIGVTSENSFTIYNWGENLTGSNFTSQVEIRQNSSDTRSWIVERYDIVRITILFNESEAPIYSGDQFDLTLIPSTGYSENLRFDVPDPMTARSFYLR